MKDETVWLSQNQMAELFNSSRTNIIEHINNIYSDEELEQIEEGEVDDVDLDEFKDEIEPWIIEALKNIGCDTARSVLNLSKDELIRRTDLEEETIQEILDILKSEFEE